MDPSTLLLGTIIAYNLLLLGIGWWASKRTHDGDDFYLGGRGLGPWVASLSSAASSSSAWTLLGVSGAAYTWGLSAFWLLPACFLGFAFNWLVLARPLRKLAHETGAVTIPELLADGMPAKWARAFVVSASLIILLSLLVYVASQFQAAGKTFAETFDLDSSTAVILGGTVVLVYTMCGGFWAVSVTDMLQGLVMVAAAILVPTVALISVGGWDGMLAGLAAANAGLDTDLMAWTRGAGGAGVFGFLIGTFGIGLGYPGQPQVVNRFMAMSEGASIRQGTAISLVWALLIYSGMLLAGWCARGVLEPLADGEDALLGLTQSLFSPVVAGIIIAAILSAIMSTADSQLLVCGSTVAHDLPNRPAKRKVLLDRLAVVGLAIAAMVAALNVQQSIFDTVLFAWSALGAAFGPLLLVRVRQGPVRPGAAFASLWAGFSCSLFWPLLPHSGFGVYELVPAFGLAWLIARAGTIPGSHGTLLRHSRAS